MFKPLLRVIPSLSGNMKLSCFCDSFKTESTNIYNCSIQRAKLISLTDSLYDNNIDVNLKNNAFEYDVKNFYKYYSDTFYSTCFDYSKVNIPVLDYAHPVNDTNNDFLYGCKRISYLQYNKQLEFFAPVYIDNVEDLNNLYFEITCIFKKNNLVKEKKLKIYLDDTLKENYLHDYVYRYVNKIDDKVIYLSSSYKNIYYGINLLSGGFLKIEDNISALLYNKYLPINDFDALLNAGFKRNRIMMKQILPLSFMFNPNELLNSYEKQAYSVGSIIISGKWFMNGEELSFYSFSDNYNSYYEKIYRMNMFGNIDYYDTNINIMNVGFPAFNESKLTNFKFINTVNKNYNRWKLKYSNDDNPYIINANFAFSKNQNSLYMYKDFPLMYTPIYNICENVNNNNLSNGYDLKFDFVERYNSMNNLISQTEKYKKLYSNNHISSFFNILNKNEDIFAHDEYWADVNEDNKLYYKGILYDFNNIYNTEKDYPRIDKFALFVLPEFSYISSSDYLKTFKTCKYFVDGDVHTPNENTNFYEFYNEHSDIISNNETIQIEEQMENSQQSFVQQYQSNEYYDMNDIYIVSHLYNVSNSLYDQYDKDIIDGYRILNVYNKDNILNAVYEDLATLYELTDKSNDSGMFFREKRVMSIESLYWAKDLLFFSIYPNITLYNLIDNYNLLYNTTQLKVNVYIKTKFVNGKEFLAFLRSIKNINAGSELQTFTSHILGDTNVEPTFKFHRYYYSTGLYNNDDNIIYTIPVFNEINDLTCNYGDRYNGDDNIIWVDPYNIKYVYRKYYGEALTDDDVTAIAGQSKEFYCKFLNLAHLHLYFKKLYKTDIIENNMHNERDILDTIYINVLGMDNIIIDKSNNSNFNNSIIALNKYIKVTDLGIASFTDLINYVEFNDNGYFSLTKKYFTDIIPIFNTKVYSKYDLNTELDQVEYNATVESSYIKLMNKRTKEVYYIKPDIEIGTKEQDSNGNFDYIKYVLYTNSELTRDSEKRIQILNTVDVDTILDFNLCFKKKMMRLNKELYGLILAINKYNYKDLYLYHLSNYDSINHELFYNTIYYEKEDNSWKLSPDEAAKRNIISVMNNKNLVLPLEPYFNDIWEEEQINTRIYSDYFLNNITEIKLQDTTKHISHVYRYNNHNIDFFISNSDIMKIASNINTDVVMNYDDVDDIVNDKDNLYKSNTSMLCYTYNGMNYGFYIIKSSFDNTKHTLNIKNDLYQNINCVDYIDGISVEDISNDTSYELLNKIYPNIIPYLKTSNIVKTALDNIEVIIQPNNYKMTNHYRQYESNNSNTLYYLNDTNNIELIRYFDNITPYLYKTNYLTTYNLYFKNTERVIESELRLKNSSYIMSEKPNTLYLNTFPGISYFDLNHNVHKFVPAEYKYLNDNVYYNIPEEFEVKCSQTFHSENELAEWQNNEDNVFNIFFNYIYLRNSNLVNHSESERNNKILFLYNKYKTEYYSQRELKLHNYTLRIKYKLL